MHLADPTEVLTRALRHHQRGELGEAASFYKEVLTLEPGHADAARMLGLIVEQGDTASADPERAAVHFRRGCDAAAAGDHQRAIEDLRMAARLSPGRAEYRYALGFSLQALGQWEAAAAVYRACVDLAPESAEAWSNLGVVVSETGDVDRAIAGFERAVALRPGDADAHFCLGVCLSRSWENERALASFDRAIQLRPGHADAHLCRGKSLYALGDLRAAIAAYREALRLRPEDAETHWALSVAHLMRGEYRLGWKEYEWRWQWAGFPSPPRNFAQPQWRGGPLRGHTILLHAEQGLGDTLQFIRYVPWVAKAGGRVVLEVPGPLYALLQHYPGVEQCVRHGDPLPEFALHCPLMGLPLAFRTTLATIPAMTPLPVPCAALSAARANLRVGLVWAGNAAHRTDRQRSCTLRQFAPLWNRQGRCRFVSLQKGPAADQLSQESVPVADGVADARDLADTARAIAQLDLVISVDTAVAHLAGAMGKPVWVLLAPSPDWRWGQQGETTPWYPSARLFRATRESGWYGLMERVALELRALEGRSLAPVGHTDDWAAMLAHTSRMDVPAGQPYSPLARI